MELPRIFIKNDLFKTITNILLSNIRLTFSCMRRGNIRELEHAEISAKRLLEQFRLVSIDADTQNLVKNEVKYLELLSLVVFWIVTKLQLEYDASITMSEIIEKYPDYCVETLASTERKILIALDYNLYHLVDVM